MCKLNSLQTMFLPQFIRASLVAQLVKNLPAMQETTCNVGDPGFDPWVGKIPWRRKGHPTSVILPGESHGQRSLAGYSPWGSRVRHNWATKPPLPPRFIICANERTKSRTYFWYILVIKITGKSSLFAMESESVSHSVISNSCDPVDCSLPDSSVHGILQARIPE